MNDVLRLAAVFGDHMVLCRRKEIRLFGEAPNGREIVACLNGASGCTVSRNGRFELALPPMEAAGPCTLTITDGESTLTYADVYVGDVYLAGGQSNMELELQNAKDGRKLTAEADDPLVRFYNVPKQPWLDEAALAAERDTRWRVLAPRTCGDVSAVAYHFAVQLRPEIGVAVGVIDCYWGGTSVSCWQDESTLRQTAAGQQYLADYAARVGDKTDEQFAREDEAFHRTFDAWGRQVDALRAANPAITPKELDALAGPCPWNPPVGRKSPFRPAGLVETMLKRVAPYTLTGMLYYQGEEDANRAPLYRALMTTLIFHWRALFRDEQLPFLFVQLPMFIDHAQQEDYCWPALREAQEQVRRSVRSCAMAVLIDCGEFDNVHPIDKEPVGHRLCLLALRYVYRRDVVAESPRAIAKHVKDGVLTVTLDQPVHCVGDAPTLLEIAGADGTFHPAQAALRDDSLRLSSAQVPHPMQARYAFVSYAPVTLFGQNGLPLAPFWLH